MLKIIGYPDRYSVAPGEKIAFKISLEEGSHFDARLVRVVHGDANPQGPGLKFRHVDRAPMAATPANRSVSMPALMLRSTLFRRSPRRPSPSSP